MPVKVYPTRASNTPTAAGALIFAKASCTFLLVLRSADSVEPGTWCTVGGGIEKGETPEEGCRREVREEVGLDGDYKLTPAMIFEKPGFTFYNYIAILEEEFDPVLNEEHDDFLWVRREELPHPLHSGTIALLADKYASFILDQLSEEARVLGISETQKREAMRLNKRKITDDAARKRKAMQDQIDNSMIRDRMKKRK